MSCVKRLLPFSVLFLCVFYTSPALGVALNDSSLPKFSPGDPRNCGLFTKTINRFEVPLGIGWDNLRNQYMGVVFGKNYSECKTSDDGKFLLPDNVNLYPVKNSKVETFAELYDHWNNYSSTTTKSINSEGAFAKFWFSSLSGSFSSEFESVKQHQIDDNSVTTRVQIRHDLYTAKLQSDSVLQPEFKSRLLDMAFHLQHNNFDYTNYLAQLLVRDFGTHYITTVDAGAILAKVDHLGKTFLANFKGDKNKITGTARASFFATFGAKYSQTIDTQDLDEYTKNIVHSTVYTFGGPPYSVNFSISQWEEQLLDELVAVDRSGDPLNYAITQQSLPEISKELIYEVAKIVQEAIAHYYKKNAIVGCTKMDSPNFSVRANLDDGSCDKPTNNSYSFGGVFQRCETIGSPIGDPCKPLHQKNPLTSAYTCSDGYEPVSVHHGTTPVTCHQDCHGWWIFKKCENKCGHASYSTYWCAANGTVATSKGYLYGGLYSDELNNPVTQARICPRKFYPLRFGAKMNVCVSDDYEYGVQQSVPFGGFFSCRAGNPLAETFISESDSPDRPKTCPTGYSQHLGAIEEDCEINFCMKSNVYNSQGFPIIRRPPYTNEPEIPNYVGQTWFNHSDSAQLLQATKRNTHDPTEGGMSTGTVVVVTLVVTAVAELSIVAMVSYWCRHRIPSIRRRSRYGAVGDGDDLRRLLHF